MNVNKRIPELRFEGFTSDWTIETLGELTDVYDGTHQTPFYKESGIMFLSVENIKEMTSNKFISIEAFNSNYSVYPQKGDILMTRIGDIGTANIVESDDKIAYYVSLALLKKKALNQYFLKSVIHSEAVWRELWHRTLHIAFPKKINMNEIKKVIINYPFDEAEQAAIGSFFRNLDDTIAQKKQQHEKTLNIKKAMLKKMFPKKGSVVPEIRFDGFTGDWEYIPLSIIAESTYGGGTPNTSKENYWNGNIPWIQSADIKENNVISVDIRKFITIKGVENSAAKIIPANSITIVTRVGVGKLCIIPFAYSTSQDFLSLAQLKTDLFFTVYAIYTKFQAEMNAVQGTSIKGVTKDELLKKSIYVPKIKDEQIAIGNFFRSLDNLIEAQQQEIEKLQNIKAACLAKMFV